MSRTVANRSTRRSSSCAAPPSRRAQEMTFSVAISMKEAVETLGRQFMQSHSGVTLRYNFGSSGELQKQIEAGAPVDVFISAAQRQMDELEQKGLITTATRRVFARNVLTVIKPAGSTLDISKPADLLGPEGTADRHRQSQDGAGRPVCRGESEVPGALGSAAAEARSRRERPAGARLRRARRGRGRLRLHDGRGGRARAGRRSVSTGRGHLPARDVSGGGDQGARSSRRSRRRSSICS